MKTKDFIKMLQEADPTGESYVRIEGGPIYRAELKPGYWDRPYSYIEKTTDNKLNWVESTKGNKIDIHTISLFDFAERYDGNWEEIKKHIIIEYDYVSKDREEEFLKLAKKECDEYNKIMKEINNK
ncbi:MAG: hypothetical protein ACOC2W_03560 [bacterium]